MTTATLDPIVVIQDCHEPGGLVTREIKRMRLTPVNLKQFWERSKVFKTLFTEDVNTDFKKFMELFLRIGPNGEVESMGLFWTLGTYDQDDFVGIYYLTDMKPGIDAQVHYSFFDQRHHGRVEITKALMRYVFATYHFHRLSAIIPLYAKQALKFVEDLGFVKEGRKRQAVIHGKDMMDCNMYGILNNEV